MGGAHKDLERGCGPWVQSNQSHEGLDSADTQSKAPGGDSSQCHGDSRALKPLSEETRDLLRLCMCAQVCAGAEAESSGTTSTGTPRAPERSLRRVSPIRTVTLRSEAETFWSSACHPIFKRSSATSTVGANQARLGV